MMRIVGLILFGALMGPIAVVVIAYGFASWPAVLGAVAVAVALFVLAVIIEGARQGAKGRRSAPVIGHDAPARRAFAAYGRARGEIDAAPAGRLSRSRPNYDPLPTGGPHYRKPVA